MLPEPEYAVTEAPRRVEHRVAVEEAGVADRDFRLALRNYRAVHVCDSLSRHVVASCSLLYHPLLFTYLLISVPSVFLCGENSSLGRSEAVPHLPDRLDEGVLRVLYLAPQPPDVYVHGPGAAKVVVSPDLV